MTNDEAIYVLKNTAWLGWDKQKEKVTETVRMAVEALKRETSGDAIDRQAVIDTLCDWICGVGERCVKTHCQCIRRIEAIPSVQPEKRTEERTETHACDCVSRQAAIGAICNACGKIDCDQMDTCGKIDIQPINSSEIPNSSDTISRQAAIALADSLKDNLPDDERKANCVIAHNEGILEYQTALSLLPFVQPEPSEMTDEQAILHLQSTGWMQNHDREMYESGLRERLADDSGSYDSLIPCEDTISRQAAIETVRKCAVKEVTPAYMLIDRAEAMTELMMLPSAQPEIIRCRDCKHSEHWYSDKCRCFLWHETGIDVFEDGFCNYAERRTDGEIIPE